jgi:hypothetical protein
MVIQIQEAFRTPNRQDQKRSSPCIIIVKMLGIKKTKRLLKAARKEHQVNYKGKPIRITANFSTDILKARERHRMLYFKPRKKIIANLYYRTQQSYPS